MNADVKAAAERLRRFGLSNMFADRCEVYGQRGETLCNRLAADRHTLADAYLALTDPARVERAARAAYEASHAAMAVHLPCGENFDAELSEVRHLWLTAARAALEVE